MTDSLGWRAKLAVVAPSTNTVVQPEFDDMRPPGVTNHFGRIYIPDDPVGGDEDFVALMESIRAELMATVDRVITCRPDHLIMGMSAETFWDGLDGSRRLQEKIAARAGVGVTMGSDACQAAIGCYGEIKRIAVITPYMPVGDSNVERFFSDCGYEVVTLKGFKCRSPTLIAHVTERELRDALIEVDDPSVEAIVQVGTNLAMARLAASAELWLDKPVLAINTATYWYALRHNGIGDKVDGFGSLLREH